MESTFFSPDRSECRLLVPDATSADAVLCRERDIVRTLQRSLDQQSHVGGTLTTSRLRKERDEFEAKYTAEKERNNLIDQNLRVAQNELETLKRGAESTLRSLTSLINEGARALSVEALQGLGDVSNHGNKDGNDVSLCDALENAVSRLETLFRVTAQHKQSEMEQRAEAHARQFESQVAALEAELREKNDLLRETRSENESISGQLRDLLVRQQENTAARASVTPTRGRPSVFMHDEEPAPPEQQVSPNFGVAEAATEDSSNIMADDSPHFSLAAPSDVLTSAKQKVASRSATAISEPTSPTPHLDKLFSATRRPRVRLHRFEDKTSSTNTSALLSSVSKIVSVL